MKGRPTKLTEPAIERVCSAIAIGATYEIAAEHAGVSRATLWNWLKKGKEQKKGIYKTLLDRFKKAEARAALNCLAHINQAAQDGTWAASAWLLERRHGYQKNVTHERTHILDQIEEKKEVQLQTTEQILMQQALQLKDAITKAEKSESWQAYAALQRQLLAVSLQLRTLQKEDTSNEYTDMHDEQILGEMIDMIQSLPPMMQQRLVNDVSSLQKQPLRIKK
jgi:AcrR family transcriptional regulator